MRHSHTPDCPAEDEQANSKSHILANRTHQFEPVGASTASEILARMQGTAFQGKQLGLAFEVWKKMLGDHCTIMRGMSGAVVPAGMRLPVVRMIENRRKRPSFKMGRELEIVV